MKSGLLVLAITSCIGLNACTMVDPDTIEKQDPPVLSENVQPEPTITTIVAEPEIPAATPVTVPKKKLRPIAAAPASEITNTTSTAPTPTTPIVEPTPAPAPVLSTWQPNEAYLFRGQELISGLQRDMGRQPSQQEMLQRLQTHMGLSAAQAQQIIATLGF